MARYDDLIARGRAHLGHGQIDDALACFEAAVTQCRQAADAHYLLGETLFLQRRLDAALRCHAAALRQGMDCDIAARGRAMSGLIPGDFGWMSHMLRGDFESAWRLGDQGLRARYENFEYLGGTGDIRVLYARTDMVPGGFKAPRDSEKADNVILGALNNTDISGLLPHLALDVLGVKHKMIVGYRGGNDVFLAMQRGEVGFHSTSISTFRSRNLGFIRSGQGIGIAYLVPVDSNGDYEKSQYVTEMPAFGMQTFAPSAGGEHAWCGRSSPRRSASGSSAQSSACSSALASRPR